MSQTNDAWKRGQGYFHPGIKKHLQVVSRNKQNQCQNTTDFNLLEEPSNGRGTLEIIRCKINSNIYYNVSTWCCILLLYKTCPRNKFQHWRSHLPCRFTGSPPAGIAQPTPKALFKRALQVLVIKHFREHPEAICLRFFSLYLILSCTTIQADFASLNTPICHHATSQGVQCKCWFHGTKQALFHSTATDSFRYFEWKNIHSSLRITSQDSEETQGQGLHTMKTRACHFPEHGVEGYSQRNQWSVGLSHLIFWFARHETCHQTWNWEKKKSEICKK